MDRRDAPRLLLEWRKLGTALCRRADCGLCGFTTAAPLVGVGGSNALVGLADTTSID